MTIPEYCAAVCRLVRFTPAHPAIVRELTGHLEDAVEARQAKGLPYDQAVEQAVNAMGDPVEVGKALDALHSPLLGWIQIWVRRALVVCTALMLLPTLLGLWRLGESCFPQENPAQWRSTQTGEALPGLPQRNIVEHSGYTLSLWDGVRTTGGAADQISLLLRLDHSSPWLCHPSEWTFQSLTVTDDLGTEYINWATAYREHRADFQVLAASSGVYDTFFSDWFVLTIDSIPPEAQTLTIALEQTGEPFSFSIPLTGGGEDG